METTCGCGSILQELQVIWDEVGESESDREKTVMEMEQECLEVYRRKVEQATGARTRLHREIAEAKAELATICSTMGELPVCIEQSTLINANLKEQLKTITPHLEKMQKSKSNRWNQFLKVIEQIRRISIEIRPTEYDPSLTTVDEFDLSMRKLEEWQRQLNLLQKEKTDRLNLVLTHLSTLNSLCIVLGIDYKEIVCEVHPSLDEAEVSKSITNDTIEKLISAIESLREVKKQRMQKLQDLASTMLELWHLMDTPVEEQSFQKVTCNIAASEHEIQEPNALSTCFIDSVAEEVSRLEALKASKMKELVLRKKTELEELSRRIHLMAEADSDRVLTLEAIEAGTIDHSLVLDEIEAQISHVKEEAFSRKEILERIEKWMNACEEESWLEEYNRDGNRYSAGHLTLKRAEKARIVVGKIPAMVETLIAKVVVWEKEREKEFIYDGIQLLTMLENYTALRQEKEQERKRQRDQKRLQGQLIAEQEVLFGSKPSSPLKSQSTKKLPKTSPGIAARRSLLGGALPQTPKSTPINTLKLLFSNSKGDEEAEISAAGEKIPDATPTSRKLFTALVSEDYLTSTPLSARMTVEPDTVSHTSEFEVAKLPEEIEYSFEERRAGFELPGSSHMKYVQT